MPSKEILDAARARRVASRYIAKRAGLLQPPPKMVDAITAWVEANTAATRLEDREGDDTLSESELREIARRGKGEAIPLNGEIAKKFPIDLRGWKYGDRLEKLVEYEMKQIRGVMQSLDEQRQILQDKGTWDDHKDFAIKMEESVRKRLKEIRSQRIRVVLKHVDSRRKGGDWSPALGIMTILITPYSPLSEIRKTVKHELTHLAQDLLTKTSDAAVKNLHTFGLPSRKIRTPWYKAPHRSVSDHSMDDREFYPKLADAVDEMRAALDRLPPEQHRDAFRKMVGEKRDGQHEGGLRLLSVLPFFLHLSRAEEGKWGKAVSVAYGELFGGSSSRVASRYIAKRAGLLQQPLTR